MATVLLLVATFYALTAATLYPFKERFLRVQQAGLLTRAAYGFVILTGVVLPIQLTSEAAWADGNGVTLCIIALIGQAVLAAWIRTRR